MGLLHFHRNSATCQRAVKFVLTARSIFSARQLSNMVVYLIITHDRSLKTLRVCSLFYSLELQFLNIQLKLSKVDKMIEGDDKIGGFF